LTAPLLSFFFVALSLPKPLPLHTLLLLVPFSSFFMPDAPCFGFFGQSLVFQRQQSFFLGLSHSSSFIAALLSRFLLDLKSCSFFLPR
jgi:hypothetical protein